MGQKSLNNSSCVAFLFLLLLLHQCESIPLFSCDPSGGVTADFPFCKVSLPMTDRVNDLIGRLTLQEKVQLLGNSAAPILRLGIGGYEWWSEALHGVSDTGRGVKFGGQFPGATSFPQVILTAASFNYSLWKAIGQAVSDEARAMHNGGAAGLTYWSPNVNIFRDPRWGRGQETPGEDPLVASRYAAAYVKGLQGNADGDYLKVAACCKHYTAYDLDSWNNTNRFHFNALVSKQDLEDTYNVPFRACVEKGKAASVMCSYNQVNGKPTCADPSLLRDTIRGQWRLNGYIVSDCDSVDVLYKFQHYTPTLEDAAAVTIKAGLDLDCGNFLGAHTEEAIKGGKLSEADVNGALANLITVQMRLGMYNGPDQPYPNLGPNDVCTSAHQQLALHAAHQGIVMLLNRDRALPLSDTIYHSVAVIGPNSDATFTMIGSYAGVPCGYTSPLEGISKYARATLVKGCASVGCPDNSGFGAAEEAATRADFTILVMGLDQGIESEGRDRVDLLLPGHQEELVSRVAKASQGPVILVLMSGGPVDVTFALRDPNISAILWAGYPGQAGGAAIADIIFGKTNPGGKLPMTWYPQDYVTKLPMTDMAMRASPGVNYPGRTYRFYKGPVVFRFGFGLTYTTFTHTLARGPTTISIPFKNTTSSGKSIKGSHTNCEALKFRLHVDVKNTGEMDGTHTLMVFSTAPASAESGDEKRLVKFKKAYIRSGAMKRFEIHVDPCKHLSVVDEFGTRRMSMGEHKLHIGDEITYSIRVQHVVEGIKF